MLFQVLLFCVTNAPDGGVVAGPIESVVNVPETVEETELTLGSVRRALQLPVIAVPYWSNEYVFEMAL
jgi:hypothetical protein